MGAGPVGTGIGQVGIGDGTSPVGLGVDIGLVGVGFAGVVVGVGVGSNGVSGTPGISLLLPGCAALLLEAQL